MPPTTSLSAICIFTAGLERLGLSTVSRVAIVQKCGSVGGLEVHAKFFGVARSLSWVLGLLATAGAAFSLLADKDQALDNGRTLRELQTLPDKQVAMATVRAGHSMQRTFSMSCSTNFGLAARPRYRTLRRCPHDR